MLGQITNQRGAHRSGELAPSGGPFGVVAIASSLGGIAALTHLLGGLPADFPLPILVCQHLRRNTPGLLSGVLARRTALRVAAAREGDVPAPGSAHVAVPDRHLLLRPDGALGLARGEPVNFCRPAADVLFRSVAEAYGPRAVAVVLTGRGRDGARGVQAIRARGGFAIAQDEGSSEAFEMPLAARDIGQADLVLPLGGIAAALSLLVAGDGEGQVLPPPLFRDAAARAPGNRFWGACDGMNRLPPRRSGRAFDGLFGTRLGG